MKGQVLGMFPPLQSSKTSPVLERTGKRHLNKMQLGAPKARIIFDSFKMECPGSSVEINKGANLVLAEVNLFNLKRIV